MTNTANATSPTASRRRRTALPIGSRAFIGVSGRQGQRRRRRRPATAGASIAMIINNNTGQMMVLQSSDNPYGQWIHGPSATLAPYSSEIVTATDNDTRGLSVAVAYSLPGAAQAVFSANNYGSRADAGGTRMIGRDGHFHTIYTNVDSGFPTMTVGYNVFAN